MRTAQGADFEWDIDANIRARAEGTVPKKVLPKRKIKPARPVRSRRKNWIWHNCQKCGFGGEYLPPDAIGCVMCSRCVALDTPHPHLHPLEWARIKLDEGILRRRRRY